MENYNIFSNESSMWIAKDYCRMHLLELLTEFRLGTFEEKPCQPLRCMFTSMNQATLTSQIREPNILS